MVALDESEWIKTENAHPPIISMMDYETVQRVLSLDTRTTLGHSGVHIFSGLLICGCCGSNMTRKTRRNNERLYIYYYCPTGKRKGCRLSFMVGENALMQVVTQKVKERIDHVQMMAHYISESNIEELVKKGCSRQIAVCHQSIRDLQNFKVHLHDSLACGILSNAEFQAHQDYYDGEVACLCAEIINLQKKSHSTIESFEDKFLWMSNFLQFIEMAELDRLAVVKMIQGIRVLKKNEIVIDFVHQHEYEQAILYLTPGG
jgi:hypothetical protein